MVDTSTWDQQLAESYKKFVERAPGASVETLEHRIKFVQEEEINHGFLLLGEEAYAQAMLDTAHAELAKRQNEKRSVAQNQ